VSLYATMLKIDVRGARARVRARFSGSGSVRAETVATSCEGVEIELFIDSDEEPSRIARLARLAEAGCFVIQTVRAPASVSMSVVLNGDPLGFHET
jgi:uncharacterized protein (DUF169 family)